MNYTANYRLQKPLGTEQYNIEVHNENLDIIDSTLNELDIRTEQFENIVDNKIDEILTEIQKRYVTKEELNALLNVVG